MPDQRPNVIVITTDQQRKDSLGCYGADFIQTPNLDRLASEGAVLERAYCANPVCMPSRASIFSGRQTSRHGLWMNGVHLPENEVLVSHRLAALGYDTKYIGKIHLQTYGCSLEESLESRQDWEKRYPEFRGPYCGFQNIEICMGHTKGGISGHYGAWVKSQVSAEDFTRYEDAQRIGDYWFGCSAFDWDLPIELHNSVWTATRAIDYLENRDPSKPFLLALGFQDPHHTHCVPRDYMDRVDPEAVHLPDFVEGELDDKPPHFTEMRTGPFSGFDFRKVSDSDARLGRAYYYSLVKLIDNEMGRVLEALDRLELSENTLIVFTTDHGELLGDHGMWMKGPFHYESLVNIPLILRWPKGIPAGGRETSVVSQVDLAPTILSAVGEAIPVELDGVDVLPLLRGETDQVREGAIIEYADDAKDMCLKTVVTQDRKLTWYQDKPYGELYDLKKDPHERVNYWDHPDYAGDKAQLMALLLSHMIPLEPRPPMTGAGA